MRGKVGINNLMKPMPTGVEEYKFLGWQNGWKHIYLDEDIKVTTGGPGEKPKKYFSYLTEDYPEYGKCRDAKHKHHELQRNQRGSENVVWCNECKIYWKYDCSD